MQKRRFLKVAIIAAVLIPFSLTAAPLWREKPQEKSKTNTQDSDTINKGKSIFIKVAKDLKPAVVNIYSTKNTKVLVPNFAGGNFYGGPEDLFNMFDNFFGNSGGYTPQIRKETALGSGFVINEEGYILTNNHVVNNADEIMVAFYDGKKLKAKAIGMDKETDIALIKVNGTGFSYASLGDSSKIEVGEWVLAIGNPFGHSQTVTAGIISAMGRVLPEVSGYNDFLQTDASINQGNSGGPLINTNGEVIGINTAIDPRAQGIGFAIPINSAKVLIPNLQTGKHLARGWLGVQLADISEEIAEYLNTKENSGAVVVECMPNSPAYKAGIRNYDIITSYDGKKIESPADVTRNMGQSSPGSVHSFVFLRNNKQYTAKVTLGNRDEEFDKPMAKLRKPKRNEQTQKDYNSEDFLGSLGLDVEDLSMENIKRYRLNDVKENSGVIVVQVGPPASKQGVRVGDIIIEANKIKITNTDDLNNAIKNKKSHLIKVNRAGTIYLIAIK